MWKHFVAMGDSLTEGVGDEVGEMPVASWAWHLITHYETTLNYTNIAKRGLLTKEIRLTQLEEAIELQPDLVSIIAGANDILKGKWDKVEYRAEMEEMIKEMNDLGATIIVANQPDFSERLPLPAEKKQLLRTQLEEANDIIRSLANEYQLVHIDFWNNPLTNDPAFLSADLIHPNSKGYLEIAKMARDALEFSS